MGLSYRQPGAVLTLTAPLGGVVSGQPYLLGGLLVVAAVTADAGEPFAANTVGTFTLAKAPGAAWAELQRLHWDAANLRLDTTPTVGPMVGVAAAAAEAAATEGDVRLDGAALGATLTPEGGMALWMVNKTGAPSVHGDVVTAGGGVSRGFVRCNLIPNPIGMVYDAGVPDGGLARVVTTGAAEVLMEDGQAPTVGYWVGISTSVAGRARVLSAPPGGGLPSEVEAHNGEIGHCLETKVAGTGVLALCVLHFN